MPIRLPWEPKRGEPLDTAWGVLVSRAQRAMQLLSSDTVEVKQTTNGTTLQVRGGKGGGGGTDTSPFVPTGFILEGVAKISFTAGLFDDAVPTIGGVHLNAFPAPAITVSGAAGLVWVKCTVDDAGILTAAEVETGETLPENTADVHHRQLASFTLAEGDFTSVTRLLFANQTQRRCAGTITFGSA